MAKKTKAKLKPRRIPKDLDPRIPFCEDRFVAKTTYTVGCQVAKQLDNTEVYLCFLPLSILATGAWVDVIDPLSLKHTGCQREINKRRIAKVASEVDSRRIPLLDPVLLNVKKSAAKVQKTHGGKVAELVLVIDPDARALMMADGQHRFSGFTFSRKAADNLSIPVVVIIGMDNLRLRRAVSDIGGNMVKHDKAFLGGMAASLMLGQQKGQITSAFNEDDPTEVRRYTAATAAEYLRCLTDSPLYGRLTLRNKDDGNRIPMQRLAELIDWVLSKNEKLRAVKEPLDISFVVIDFLRAVHRLVGDDEFSSGVMLSHRGAKVLARLLWHVAEELIDELPDGSFCYRGTGGGRFADAETRYEQVLDLLRPLRLWQQEGKWLRCHSDKQASVNTWYALMLITLGWEGRPSPVPGIKGQVAMLKGSK